MKRESFCMFFFSVGGKVILENRGCVFLTSYVMKIRFITNTIEREGETYKSNPLGSR